MDYQNMGELIAALRKEQQLTQQDLADKLGVTDKAVSKWERGISCPDIRTIPRLAETLHVSVEELLNLQKNQPVAQQERPGGQVRQLLPLILKAIGLAMGVAVVVLSTLDSLESGSAFTMLGLGLVCLAITLLQEQQ